MQLNGVDAAVVDPQLRPPPTRASTRRWSTTCRATRRSPAYHHRLAAQPTDLPRLPERGARLRARPLRAGAGPGPGPVRRRAAGHRREDVRLHRPAGRLHPGQRPAHPARPLPQGAAARPAPDARPLRRALHRRGRRRRRRDARVRPLRHRHHRRLRGRLPRLPDPRPRLRDRPRLPADLLFVRRALGLQPQGRRPRRRQRRPTRPTSRSTSRRPCARTRTCCSIR